MIHNRSHNRSVSYVGFVEFIRLTAICHISTVSHRDFRSDRIYVGYQTERL